MQKDEWVRIAIARLKDHLGDNCREYAENLYTVFVEKAPDDLWADDPDGAVREDMADWDWDTEAADDDTPPRSN